MVSTAALVNRLQVEVPDHHQHRDRGRRPRAGHPQAARHPGLHKRPLDCRQFLRSLLYPHPRLRQRHPAQQEIALTPTVVPFRRRRVHLLLPQHELPILVDPAAQALPAVQQGFVGHLDRLDGRRRAARRDQQPLVAQAADQRQRGVRELAGGCPAAGVLLALPRSHQAQEQPLHLRLLGQHQLADQPLGLVGDRPRQPADRLIRLRVQQVPLAPVPQLAQRKFQQRQVPRLVLRIGQHPLHQPRLDAQPRHVRRPLDRLAQLLHRHRPERHHRPALQPVRQRPVLRDRPPEKIPPQRQHHRQRAFLRRLQQRVDEAAAVVGVVRLRDQFFPLIDDEHQPIRPRLLLQHAAHHVPQRGAALGELLGQPLDLAQPRDLAHPGFEQRQQRLRQRPQRSIPGPQRHDLPDRRPITPQPRHQPRPHQRRLARPRRPDHRDQGLLAHQREQPIRRHRAPEEKRLVLLAEIQQPAERTQRGTQPPRRLIAIVGQRVRPRRLTPDRPFQDRQPAFVLDRGPQIDPGELAQEPRRHIALDPQRRQ